MFKPISKEIREEIIAKVKEGQKVLSLASQYGISDKTIYQWLARLATPQITWVKYNRLRKENEELKRIIGMMALDIEQGKKRKIRSSFGQ